MMNMAVTLNAKSRENLKKSATKKLRATGLVPAVVYGKSEAARPISINELELVKTVRDEGRNAIISLKVEESGSLDVMLHDYQMDPIRNELVHADFFVVNMKEEMEAPVPIRLVGEAVGAKEGGVVQQPLFELTVRAKPRDIPEEIEVNVEALAIGDSLTIADLSAAADYSFAEDPETTVVTVTAPTVVEESTEEADENAEPEVINEKKEASEEK